MCMLRQLSLTFILIYSVCYYIQHKADLLPDMVLSPSINPIT